MSREGEAMKRGGRKRKGKKSSKATQQQIVNVKVKVGDTVQLEKGNAPKRTPFGEFRLLQGVGAKYANPPVVQLPSTYGIYPASKAPMYDDVIRVGGGAKYNENKVDDYANSTAVNPFGIAPNLKPSKVAIPSKDMYADRRVNYEIQSQLPMKSADPSPYQVPYRSPSMRAVPAPAPSLSDLIKAQAELPNLPGGEASFGKMEQDVLIGMGINPETGSPLPSSPRKASGASASNMRRGGSVF